MGDAWNRELAIGRRRRQFSKCWRLAFIWLWLFWGLKEVLKDWRIMASISRDFPTNQKFLNTTLNVLWIILLVFLFKLLSFSIIILQFGNTTHFRALKANWNPISLFVVIMEAIEHLWFLQYLFHLHCDVIILLPWPTWPILGRVAAVKGKMSCHYWMRKLFP